jgi:voltage-gated sodium channel
MFAGIVVLLNFLVMTAETQAAATNDKEMSAVVAILESCFLLFYTVEVCARVYLLGFAYFSHAFNNLDFTIVSLGIVSVVVEHTVGKGNKELDSVAMLKSVRVLRLLRLAKLLVSFPQLYVLVVGMERCLKTLMWASILIFMVVNVWAILSVEFLDPLMKELALDRKANFGTCTYCPTAFANVWLANLTWFEIVSGNGWGNIGRPLVEQFVWPYVLFASCIFIVVWGLLNIIVATIVDANLAAREEDVEGKATLRRRARIETCQEFEELVKRIDSDGNGHVSAQEFKDFCHHNPEFQGFLMNLGISEQMFLDLLVLMDKDGNGEIDYHEFINELADMRSIIVETSLFCVLRYVQDVRDVLHEMKESNKHPKTREDSDFEEQPQHTEAKASEANNPGVKPGWYYFGDPPMVDLQSLWRPMNSSAETGEPPRVCVTQRVTGEPPRRQPSGQVSPAEAARHFCDSVDSLVVGNEQWELIPKTQWQTTQLPTEGAENVMDTARQAGDLIDQDRDQIDWQTEIADRSARLRGQKHSVRYASPPHGINEVVGASLASVTASRCTASSEISI